MSEPKFPVERADLTRLPFGALAVVAKVIESGDRKYAAGDWIMAPQRIDGRRDVASALKHIGEWINGIDVDEDSGESPLAHAAARLLFLLEREARGIKGGGWRIGTSAHPLAGYTERLGGLQWHPIADQEAISRAINGRPLPRFCPAFRDRGGKPFLCALAEGHDGAHSFTVEADERPEAKS